MPSRFEYERSIRSSDLPPLSRLLALTLATWADVKTGVIAARHTPSLSTLEEGTGMDRSTVRRHLNKLEAAGWVKRDRPTVEAARSKKARTRYRIVIPEGAAVPEMGGDELGAENTEARGTQPLEPSQARGTVPLEKAGLGAHSPHSWGHTAPRARGTVPLKSSYGPNGPKEEEQLQRARNAESGGTEDADALRTVQPLIDEMTRRGMRVTWRLQAADWKELRDLVCSRGAPALVDHAERVWKAAKATPYSARYFLDGWRGLPEIPAGSAPPLRAVSGGHVPFRNPTDDSVWDEDLI